MNSSTILITGGTGLIGQALIPRLVADGCRVFVLTRKPHQYPGDNPQVKPLGFLTDIPQEQSVDAVINLAGARIVGPRWTDGRKRVLMQSRVDLTRNLVQWMSRRNTPPGVLLSGSAVGFYGDCPGGDIDESHPPGNDFGAELCQRWESVADEASQFGCRVIKLRTGLVLSGSGGMLPPMLLSFRLGLGAKLGHGNQWMSWIHIDDHIAAMGHLLADPDARGAYNLTAPNPVTNREFSDSLARVLNRPRLFSAPASVLKLLLGESAGLLLGGQKALPNRLSNEGYKFRYPELVPAFRAIAGR